MLQQFTDKYEYFSSGWLPPGEHGGLKPVSAKGSGDGPPCCQVQICCGAQSSRRGPFSQSMVDHEKESPGLQVTGNLLKQLLGGQKRQRQPPRQDGCRRNEGISRRNDVSRRVPETGAPYIAEHTA